MSTRTLWRATAAYLYLLRLDASSLAWEYLRRNPRYRQDWQLRKSATDPTAVNWRLAAFENPDLDALEAQPIWQPQADGVIRLVAYPLSESSQAKPFSLWRIAGRKTLCHDGHGLLLKVVLTSGTLRVAIPAELGDGDGFAYVVCIDARARRRWHEIVRCEATIHPRHAGPIGAVATRADRIGLAHMRSIQALDGVLAGASQRDIAAVVFGPRRVDEGWHADGALRAQIRYLIRRGRASMTGGYVGLVNGTERYRFAILLAKPRGGR